MPHGPWLFVDIFAWSQHFPCFGSVAMPSIYNKMQPIGGTASDSTTKDSRRLCSTLKIFQVDCGSMESESTWRDELPPAVQFTTRNLTKSYSRSNKTTLPLICLPWTNWWTEAPKGAYARLIGLVDSAPSPDSRLLQPTSRLCSLPA